MKFRKKPVVIEAKQFSGTAESGSEIVEWASGCCMLVRRRDFPDGAIMVNTLYDQVYVLPGDWIIKGIKGEFYPCKPDIFEATYEPVDTP
jgi:hypothetical protein